MEKIAYAVFTTVRKLRHYFEGHQIRVITNHPLNDLFTNKDATGRIVKRAEELSGYVVDFERRSALKSQVLADFVVDCTSPIVRNNSCEEVPWVIYCDGAWCGKGVGISAIVTSPSGIKIRYAARLDFPDKAVSTNNTIEYEALLLALRKMKALGQQTFIVKSDSKVIQGHVEKESKSNKPRAY